MTGTFVTNFAGVTPPARYDGVAWTVILVEEAATEALAEAGTFTLIATVSIASLPGGVDEEPGNPAARDITVSNCTAAEGFYRFVFEDEGSNTSAPTATIKNGPTVEGAIRPSLEDLGALLHSRTVVPGSGGNEVGTFTSQTRPTATEAQFLIDNAVNQTILTIGPNIAECFWPETRTVILYLAAQLLELSFYKNEISKGISAYPQYKELWAQSIDGLTKSINSDTPASATQSYFTVPILTKQQARFKAFMEAYDPVTGVLDPTKLPPDMDYPMGPGGLPAWWFAAANSWPNALDMGMPGSATFLDEPV
jgi:hypothetical protein